MISISIHALLAESDPPFLTSQKLLKNFYPRSPCGERRQAFSCTAQHIYFYPRSPCGERHRTVNIQRPTAKFLSTLSLRRATVTLDCLRAMRELFLSTLSLRRATFSLLCRILFRRYFYPRSPCGERPTAKRPKQPKHHFYPRSPCGERLGRGEVVQRTLKFLSTLSLRRATETTPYRAVETQISIHALLAESDLPAFLSGFWAYLFLSTLSLRRAT